MNLPRFISSTDVPPQFLKATYLVGTIPFKALRTDPRISYSLYIPPQHHNPDPSRQHGKDSENIAPPYQLSRLPLIVSIHGTRRNAEASRDRLIALANESRAAILAPLFPAGIDDFNDLDNYKLLRYKSLRCDTALLDMLDEVKFRWHGIATEKVFLVGFSGGGQFVHRFMYLYPERLHAVSIGSPGRVTVLDNGLNWPAGIKNVVELFDGTVIDKNKIRELEIQLVVGGADTEAYGGVDFQEWLRAKKGAVLKSNGLKAFGSKHQEFPLVPEGRVADLERLRSNWEKYGIQVQFNVADGVEHFSEGVNHLVVEFLRPLVDRQHISK